MDRSRKLSTRFVFVWFGIWITLICKLFVGGVQLYGGIILSVIFAVVSYVLTLIVNNFVNLD